LKVHGQIFFMPDFQNDWRGEERVEKNPKGKKGGSLLNAGEKPVCPSCKGGARTWKGTIKTQSGSRAFEGSGGKTVGMERLEEAYPIQGEGVGGGMGGVGGAAEQRRWKV